MAILRMPYSNATECHGNIMSIFIYAFIVVIVTVSTTTTTIIITCYYSFQHRHHVYHNVCVCH
ncbi:MAG: hypothetical protein ACYDEQ_02960 [Desulfocucumaceae bacterium]